jgi:cytochrome c
VAFLITYAHKYSWDLPAERKGLHLAIGASGTALFLLVPFVFLANINLMLFPERWTEVRGFLSTLLLPNVVPRYLHFLTASVAVAALFLMGFLGRRRPAAGDDPRDPDLTRARQEFGAVAFGATCLQMLVGPLVFVTLPSHGLSWPLVLNILAGVSLAIVALTLLWRELRTTALGITRRYLTIVVLLFGTVVFMAYGRHLYREEALAQHRALMAERTAEYQSAVRGAQMREATGALRVGAVEQVSSPGERVFRAVCMACHGLDERKVGPPLTEIVRLYEGNPDGIIEWVREPGKKRPGYPLMPPIRMRDEQYRAVASYILEEVL